MSEHNLEAWLEFHAHEMDVGIDPAWASFIHRVKKALGLPDRNGLADGLDGDESEDGYSLDSAHDFFAGNLTVEDYVLEVRANQAAIAASKVSP